MHAQGKRNKEESVKPKQEKRMIENKALTLNRQDIIRLVVSIENTEFKEANLLYEVMGKKR